MLAVLLAACEPTELAPPTATFSCELEFTNLTPEDGARDVYLHSLFDTVGLRSSQELEIRVERTGIEQSGTLERQDDLHRWTPDRPLTAGAYQVFAVRDGCDERVSEFTVGDYVALDSVEPMFEDLTLSTYRLDDVPAPEIAQLVWSFSASIDGWRLGNRVAIEGCLVNSPMQGVVDERVLTLTGGDVYGGRFATLHQVTMHVILTSGPLPSWRARFEGYLDDQGTVANGETFCEAFPERCVPCPDDPTDTLCEKFEGTASGSLGSIPNEFCLP